MTVPQQPPPQPQQALFAPDRIPNDIILALEGASLKVPFEEARRYSRMLQRILEKDLSSLLNAYHEKKAIAEDDAGIEKRLQERLLALRDKVEQSHQKEVDYLKKLQYRREYLDKLLSDSTNNSQYQEWLDVRLKRLVVEYYLDHGDIGFAESLINEMNIEGWVDVEVYSDRLKIMKEITHDKSFQSALQWCTENRPSLKKSKSILEFSLRRQEMIEIARKGSVVDSISYGKKYLYSWLDSKDADDDLLWGLAESAMGHIIFCDASNAAESFEETAQLFKKEYNALYSLNEPPLLLSIIRAGLTVIKTPSCGDPEHFNASCPACQPELVDLAKDLPYAHHDNSILVCRITGERMDEDNPPMALPNGYVYSMNGLKKHCCAEESSKIKCPRSGQEYEWEELRKVYIT